MANDSQGSPKLAPAKATGSDPFYQRFGLTVPGVYEVALSFYRAGKIELRGTELLIVGESKVLQAH